LFSAIETAIDDDTCPLDVDARLCFKVVTPGTPRPGGRSGAQPSPCGVLPRSQPTRRDAL